MILTTLGTGTVVPEPDRRCAAHVISAADVRMLMDCGPGAVHRMAEAGVEWRTLTHLAITHFHNDHIGDIPMLFFAWRHGMRPSRGLPLDVIGPIGTARLLAGMGIFGDHVARPSFPIRVHECDGGESMTLANGVHLRCERTPHTDVSLAFRLEDGSAAVCYTGDTGESEDVARFAAGSDVFLAECSLPDSEGMATHLTPSRLASMARLAQPALLVVTHCYPQLDRRQVPALLRDGGWMGATHVATDGDQFDVKGARLRGGADMQKFGRAQ